ncbi:unnamed protein product [Penicillium salamii]|uniref:Uncharacterized protein n=1 Tax=Penicillium salamii TaxID=1612424 RepID=A0A9W4IFH7_9EURO|nr:unnamed protein product [Penicillium salamii]CAG8098861.1 unnamed protein product [Penicillium salamii]CAG8156029.1 unnamed protein product [Penicillium salamii]CAG8160510.1 unnamed protein product [Penicillium salamii]CAG8219586.1 unnamed protein product [Penicillium salamii]
MLRHIRTPPMLQIKSKEAQPPPPSLDHNTTKSPLKSNGSSKNTSLGAVMVFIARATDLMDHPYPNASLTSIQVHEYLRNLLVMTSTEHRKVYNNLGGRPHKIQTIIQPSNHRLPSNGRVTKFLAAALADARDTKTECIFVLYNWDGWTTDYSTIIEMSAQHRDVPFSLHVYAKGHDVPREFYEADGHKVAEYFRHRENISQESLADDRNTVLFIRMIEALHNLHNQVRIPLDIRRDLVRYDCRFL